MIHRNGVYSEFRDASTASKASQQLEADGYTMVRGLFDADELAVLRDEMDSIFASYPRDKRAAERAVEEDEMFRYEMLNRGAACQAAVSKRALLDVIEPLLGEDCHVIANTAWRNEANFEAYPHGSKKGGGFWHIDAGPHIPLPEGVNWPRDIPHPVFAIGVHIFVQDCRSDDGPTGVIPGSHLSGRFPPFAEAANPELTFNGNGAVILTAQAGDVCFFVSDVWHRRMPTGPGDAGRYFLQVHYGRRDIAQRIRSTSEVNHLADEAVARAGSEREKQLLGIHKNFFYDG